MHRTFVFSQYENILVGDEGFLFCEAAYRGKNDPTRRSRAKRVLKNEHTRYCPDRGGLPHRGLCVLRAVDRAQVGDRPQGENARRRQKRRQGLCPDKRLDRIQPPVQLHCRRRPRYRRDSGCGFRLASGSALGADRRHLLRRRHGFRRAVRQRQERRQIDGHDHRKIHRQARQEAVPAVQLAVHAARHRGVCGHGGRHLQRLYGE